MEYKEKLKHPLWQKKKCEIMTRDGFKCQKCGSIEKTLHVHHITYDNVKNGNPWECPNEDLVTWCEDCHSEFHHEELLEKIRYHYEHSWVDFNNLIWSYLNEENVDWRREILNFLIDNYGINLKKFYQKETKKNKYGKEEDVFTPISIMYIDPVKLNALAKKRYKEWIRNED